MVVGDTYRTCLGDKSWSGKLPTCQGKLPNDSVFFLGFMTSYVGPT